ncbi:hypothetical protein AeNC1_009702 [Aphanomyces euteiches]|nr:hypothetical protein AeNC1_009702 [Aphanomyces euteiches]
MESHREDLPLPDSFRCQLAVKIGKPLGKSRSSIGQPTMIQLQRRETFGVVKATLVDTVTEMVDRHHSIAGNTKCMWDPSTSKEFYVKYSANATQDRYTLLDFDNYSNILHQVWDNTKKSQRSSRIYTSQKRTERLTIRRATQQNIASASVRLADHIREHSLQLGPLQTQYASVVAARLPANEPIEIPANMTMQQLTHVDRMAATHAEERRREINYEMEPYRKVRIRLGTITSAPIECYLAVDDLRRCLGLPQCDLTPVYRNPLNGMAAPESNLDDIDHRSD